MPNGIELTFEELIQVPPQWWQVRDMVFCVQ